MVTKTDIQQAFKLALSITLLMWLALAMNWGMPKYGALAIAAISLGNFGASLQKGWHRMVGTTVGLVAGMFAISAFSQQPWPLLGFLCLYVTIAAYGMQGSPSAYAWMVGGFMAPLIWASSYGHEYHAFYLANIRYLETTAGVLIYTVVDALLWPRRAGGLLLKQGQTLWPQLSALLRERYQEMQGASGQGTNAAEMTQRLRASLKQMQALLQASVVDTQAINERKAHWQLLFADLRAFQASLEMWRQAGRDCQALLARDAFPGLEQAVCGLEDRLRHMESLWASLSLEDTFVDGSPERSAPAPVEVAIPRETLLKLNEAERAALLNFAAQTRQLAHLCDDFQRQLEAIVAEDAPPRPEPSGWQTALFQRPFWEPERFKKALFVGANMIGAVFLWLWIEPPTGPLFVVMVTIFGMLLLTTPFNPAKLLLPLLIMMWVVVGPIYFLVMPALETGPQLLSLVFVYCFAFGCLGGKAPMIKLLGIMVFFMMTGIENQNQQYSFQTFAIFSVVFALTLGFLSIGYLLWTSGRPDVQLMASLRKVFRECAATIHSGAQAVGSPVGNLAGLRRIKSKLIPALNRLPALSRQLDRKLLPESGETAIEPLLSAVELTGYRVAALALELERWEGRAGALPDAVAASGQSLIRSLQTVFHQWSLRDFAADGIEALHRELDRITGQLGALTDVQADNTQEVALAETYALLGCTRGLVDAMGQTREAASRLDWERWTEARF